MAMPCGSARTMRVHNLLLQHLLFLSTGRVIHADSVSTISHVSVNYSAGQCAVIVPKPYSPYPSAVFSLIEVEWYFLQE